MDSIIVFREIYIFINEVTIDKAVKDGHTSLLIDMITEDNLNHVAVTTIMEVLADNDVEGYKELFKELTHHKNEHIREYAAYWLEE